MKRLLFPFLFFFALTGSGCNVQQTSTDHAQVPIQEFRGWKSVENGAARAEYSVSEPPGRIYLYRFDPDMWDFSFMASSTSADLQTWRQSNEDAALLTNGVYFDVDGSPSGLLIADGKRIGNKSFDATSSAMVILHPIPNILGNGSPKTSDHARDAAQSYPLLIANGRMNIAADTGKLAWRTFIGTDRDGKFYIGIAREDVSLYVFAKQLLDLPIEWDMALNLDGGPSSGLMSRLDQDDIFPSLVPVPNVLIVKKK